MTTRVLSRIRKSDKGRDSLGSIKKGQKIRNGKNQTKSKDIHLSPCCPLPSWCRVVRAASSWRRRAAHCRRLAAHQTNVRFPRFYQERTEDSERKESNEIQRYCRGQVAYYYLVPRFYQERTDGRFRKERIKRNPKIKLPWPR